MMIVACPAPALAESWLCLTEKSSGFRYDASKQEWVTSTFKVEDERFTIRKPTTGSNAYEVRKFGPESVLPEAWCKNGFDKATPFLHCSGVMGEFKFSRLSPTPTLDLAV